MSLLIEAKPVPLRVTEKGVILVGQTRIPIDTVIYAYNKGDSAEEIVAQYDALKLADVYAVISYYLEHQAEIDSYIQRRQLEAEAIRREIDKRFDQEGFRDKLLARHDSND